MFFNDDFNRRKVNMGNYSLTSKDDFLKKMEEEEKKEKNQKKIDKAKTILKQFFKTNFEESTKAFAVRVILPSDYSGTDKHLQPACKSAL